MYKNACGYEYQQQQQRQKKKIAVPTKSLE
jgi:hypothetical protein